MSFVFTSQKTLEDIRKISNAYYITESEDSSPIVIRTGGNTSLEAYESFAEISEKILRNIKKSKKLRGFKFGICDCHLTKENNKFRMEGRVFCTDYSNSDLRELCSRSTERSYSR